MRAEETFDSFYLKTRRALVHQTFALTGDLAAAQHAVREAYVEAWHHWRKVRNNADPRDWVRPRAWSLAQRRHTARLWQRTRDLSAEERAVLDALHKLPVAERRALLMVQLVGGPLDVGARELYVTSDQLEREAESASTRFALELGTDASDAQARLLALDEAASRAALPRPAGIRREGRARRRTHTLVAAAAVSFLAVGSGAFAYQPADAPSEADGPAPTAPPPDPAEQTEPADDSSRPTVESTLPSADDLLDSADLRSLDPRAAFRVTSTHDNTSGEGINYVCQQERFADPEGLAALVRTVEAPRPSAPAVVQALEISGSEEDATQAYRTVLSWFAGCEGGDLQLRRTFAVKGVSDRAALLQLQSWERPQTYYAVEVAQLGQVVTTSTVRTTGAPVAAPFAANALEQANRKICRRTGGDCGGKRPKVEATGPPLSTESPGALATVDMPPLVGVRKPWVGTQVTSGARNPAATSCDRAQFGKMGAQRARTRTFLVPGARLPDWFGLTETYGTFPSTKAATTFMRTVRGRFASCEDRDLATQITSAQSFGIGRLDGSTWRLQTELSQNREVYFDVGFVRRGDAVAQLTFVPTGPASLQPGAFRDLVIRAGERLGELR